VRYHGALFLRDKNNQAIRSQKSHKSFFFRKVHFFVLTAVDYLKECALHHMKSGPQTAAAFWLSHSYYTQEKIFCTAQFKKLTFSSTVATRQPEGRRRLRPPIRARYHEPCFCEIKAIQVSDRKNSTKVFWKVPFFCAYMNRSLKRIPSIPHETGASNGGGLLAVAWLSHLEKISCTA
jgi:hypothetical protein